jgi:putative sterol carrier protein
VSRWLSDEWFEASRRLATGLPGRPGLDGRVQLEVTGGPDGDVRAFWEIAGGRSTAGGTGPVEHPDLTLTAAWDVGAAIGRGELDPSVAYMRGTLKAAGDNRLLLGLLELAATPEGREVRQRIAEVTEF